MIREDIVKCCPLYQQVMVYKTIKKQQTFCELKCNCFSNCNYQCVERTKAKYKETLEEIVSKKDINKCIKLGFSGFREIAEKALKFRAFSKNEWRF